MLCQVELDFFPIERYRSPATVMRPSEQVYTVYDKCHAKESEALHPISAANFVNFVHYHAVGRASTSRHQPEHMYLLDFPNFSRLQFN
ncbi:hypothetical protein Ciccas_004909 [Cichlidogyrus casuarinus]|uniref:Uncharacterized protein n=1 Tax=Cichlidogyrus casuarinus TaxID=1844966 RepID=A0ABD2QA72_9PLAT